jgi:hypothetical protein
LARARVQGNQAAQAVVQELEDAKTKRVRFNQLGATLQGVFRTLTPESRRDAVLAIFYHLAGEEKTFGMRWLAGDMPPFSALPAEWRKQDITTLGRVLAEIDYWQPQVLVEAAHIYCQAIERQALSTEAAARRLGEILRKSLPWARETTQKHLAHLAALEHLPTQELWGYAESAHLYQLGVRGRNGSRPFARLATNLNRRRNSRGETHKLGIRNPLPNRPPVK